MSEESRAMGEKATLREEILQDARTKGRRAVERARREVEGARERSAGEMKVLREKMTAQAQERAKQQRAILMAPLEVEARRERLRRQEEVVEEVFAQALQKLRRREEMDYKMVLAGLIQDAVRQMEGERFRVTAGQEDSGIFAGDFLRGMEERIRKELGREVKLEARTDAKGGSPGVVVTSADGRQEVDNRFEARLRRMREELRMAAGSLLFGDEGECR